MAVHYEEFRLYDPSIIGKVVGRWPFATVMANGPEWPAVAHTPLVFKEPAGDGQLGAVEFHLARANPAFADFLPGKPVTLSLLGPSAHVSPSWYVGRFPSADSDRSRTAPTWNYLNPTLRGRLSLLSDTQLAEHLADLVAQSEGDAGWRIAEIDQQFFVGLRNHITGFRVEAEAFDCVSKFNQDKSALDRSGVIDGLRRRGRDQDASVADFMETLARLEESGQATAG